VAGEEFAGLGRQIIGAAMRVHSILGPGLLESAYEICLEHELNKAGLRTARQITLPVIYDGVRLDAGYRLDLVVEEKVVLELKAIDRLQAVHTAQLVSYLRLSGYLLGYILNFNVAHMRDGIKRVVNPSVLASDTSEPSV
jgi:GxxExxY protein